MDKRNEQNDPPIQYDSILSPIPSRLLETHHPLLVSSSLAPRLVFPVLLPSLPFPWRKRKKICRLGFSAPCAISRLNRGGYFLWHGKDTYWSWLVLS
uniref:Autophagy-related protein 9 n=1 Tax=Oryza punctata TaxID=4537 RepID=A0A0E0KBA1_ORYPU